MLIRGAWRRLQLFRSLKLKSVLVLGKGFSENELPSVDYYRRLTLGGAYCTVFQLVDDSAETSSEDDRIIGFFTISDSYLARTNVSTSVVCFSNHYSSLQYCFKVTCIYAQHGHTAPIECFKSDVSGNSIQGVLE